MSLFANIMDYLQNVNSSSQRRYAATPRQFHVVIHKISVGRKPQIFTFSRFSAPSDLHLFKVKGHRKNTPFQD